MLTQLTVDEFLDRIATMPGIEAQAELVLRKEQSAGELAMLQTELHRLDGEHVSKGDTHRQQVGRAFFIVTTDLGRLNLALKEVKRAVDRAQWSMAVRTVLGDEAYDRCRVWMAQNVPNGKPVDADRLQYMMAKYGGMP